MTIFYIYLVVACLTFIIMAGWLNVNASDKGTAAILIASAIIGVTWILWVAYILLIAISSLIKY